MPSCRPATDPFIFCIIDTILNTLKFLLKYIRWFIEVEYEDLQQAVSR